MLNILKYFPDQITKQIKENSSENLEEIRIRTNLPIILKYQTEEKILTYKPTQEETLKILQLICDNSIYSYQNQICNGYITVEGGHRVRHYRGCSPRRTEKSKTYHIYIV